MNSTVNTAPKTQSIKQALNHAMLRLRGSALDKLEHISESDLQLDTEVLLGFCLNKPRAFIHAWPEYIIPEKNLTTFEAFIKKRAQVFPIAYLIGEQEFWSLTLKVNQEVLIPRPETECLVEFIIKELSNHNNLADKKYIKGLDLGTGSGAIALALSHEKPKWIMEACDFSSKALEVAKHNKKKLGLNAIKLIYSDWFSDIESNDFNFIVSNPPYIEEDAVELVNESIQYEPRSALCSAKQGLADIEKICQHAPQYLKNGGFLIIEHGYQQGQSVAILFKQQGFLQVSCYQDYAGLDRFTVGFKRDL